MSDKLKQLAAKIEEAVTGAVREAYFPHTLCVDLPNGYSAYIKESVAREYFAFRHVSSSPVYKALDLAYFDSEDELLAQVKEWAQLGSIEV